MSNNDDISGNKTNNKGGSSDDVTVKGRLLTVGVNPIIVVGSESTVTNG